MPYKDKEAYNKYLKEYMLNRYYERKAWAIDKLGGECYSCGCVDDLEFDHVDPENKGFTVGRKIVSVAQEILEEELKKCQLLCNSCHKEKHYPGIAKDGVAVDF